MPGYSTRLQRVCYSLFRKGYYRYNVFNYNANKDLGKWLALPSAVKVESYRQSSWKEKCVYLWELTKPRVKPMSSVGDVDVDRDKSVQVWIFINLTKRRGGHLIRARVKCGFFGLSKQARNLILQHLILCSQGHWKWYI